MSGQLKRTNLLAGKRSRAYSSKRNLVDADLTRADLSPSLHRVPSPSFSALNTFLSPYATLKRESGRRSKSRNKGCSAESSATNETLNRSFSCLQATPKLSRSSKARASPAEGRWSVTPKEERTVSNSRLLASTKLEAGTLDNTRLLAEETPEHGFAFASELMDELAASHPRLCEILALIRSGYEHCIDQLTSELRTSQRSLAMLQIELDSSRKQVAALQTLVTSLQDKISLCSAPAKDDGYKRQNEFLVQVLRYMNGRGYPVKAAYAEVQRQTGSTADSGDSPGPAQFVAKSGVDKEGKIEAKPRIVVPRLKLPQEHRPDFQDEFFSKLEEFSESWKIQIPKNHQDF